MRLAYRENVISLGKQLITLLVALLICYFIHDLFYKMYLTIIVNILSILVSFGCPTRLKRTTFYPICFTNMPFLRVTSFVGWTCGLILLDRPWGIPRFTSWFSLTTLISLGMLITVLFLTTDMIINYSDFVEHLEASRLGVYISKIASVHRTIFYFITRFTFLLNAKKLANVFTRLYFYPMRDGNVLSRNLKIFDCVLISLSYICVIVIACNSTAVLIKLVDHRDNFMLNVFGPTGYGVIVAILGILPMGLSDTVPFALVIATVRANLRIFKEFCDDLEYFLRQKHEFSEELVISNKNPLMYSGSLIELENEFKRFVHPKNEVLLRNANTNADTNPRYNIACRPETRQELVNKFFDMMDIFDCAGNAMSPFVFVLLIVATVELVATVSAVVVIGHQGVFLVNDIAILAKVAVHMCLLQVGHRIKVTLEKGKNQVRRAFIESSTRHKNMRDVVTAVLRWDWKLTGLGFFDVDRRLAAGTMSLLLSYVVIIFQLQLALSPNSFSGFNKE